MSDITVTRRDMLEVEKVTGQPFGKLFIQDGDEQVATALGTFAIQYVVERRTGVTELEWDDWLDGDMSDVELDIDVSDVPPSDGDDDPVPS